MKKPLFLIGTLLALLPLLALAAGADADSKEKTQMQQDKQQLEQQNHAQLEQQLQQAQQKLQAAAQQVARLSMQLNGPDIERAMRMRFFRPDHAILGVTISDAEDAAEDGKGVKISAVTPGGPAEKAGLRAGDVITGINDATFKSKRDASAADRLVEFMDDVKPGDNLKVAYLRAGKAATAGIKAGHLDRDSFAYAFRAPPAPPAPPTAPVPPAPPVAPMPPHFAWFMNMDPAWGDMQLVPLSKTLGQYFGTEKGLLVVHAPPQDVLKLQDGDVILNIGGRVPGSPPHAMRILHSYAPGDTVKLDIMRKGKPVNLSIKLPARNDMDMGGDISQLYQRFHFGPSFLHFGFE